jgi:hypothetical protein
MELIFFAVFAPRGYHALPLTIAPLPFTEPSFSLT